MGKKTAVTIACVGIVGTYNAINSFGVEPVVESDIATTGVVTDKSATELQHRMGVTLDRTYEFAYSFQAGDGETYRGKHIVEEPVFNALSKGQEIRIQYHSNNPSINGDPDYGYYASVASLPQSTPTFRLYFRLGTLAFGMFIAVVGMRIEKESTVGDVAPAT